MAETTPQTGLSGDSSGKPEADTAPDSPESPPPGGYRRFLSWRLIGPVVVIGAIWWADPAKVWAELSAANGWLIAAALGMAIPLTLVKGLRWKVLLDGFGGTLSFGESTRMYAMGMALAAVTPGRLGDFAKILALRRRGFRLSIAVFCNVFDRLLDVGFILLAGYGSMWYFSHHFASQLRLIHVIAGIGLALLVLLAVNRRMAARLGMKLVPAAYRPAVGASWNEIASGLWSQGPRRALPLLASTAASWLCYFFAIWLCCRSLNLDVPFLYISACAALVSIASFLPITVAGAGTRDAIFVLLLGQLGLENQQSLALSSLVLGVFLGNCVVFYLISALVDGGHRETVNDRLGESDE